MTVAVEIEDGPRSGEAGRYARLVAGAAQPVDASLLAFARIVFGVVLSWELWRYLDLGFPDDYFVDRPLNFTFWPFDFLEPPSSSVLTGLFVGMSLCGALIAVGAFLRAAGILLWAGMLYVFLLDKAYYLNHWYLGLLLALLFGVMPANRMWSIDARSGAVRRSDTVPAWTVWMLRLQVGIVYFYAGLCKVNGDWIRGWPLRIWMADDGDFPLIGPLLTAPASGVAMAWLAMVFDIAVVPLLLSHRTRRFAYPIAMGFHLMNSRLFGIGMFPWAMIGMTLVFFPADFPRRMLADLREGRRRFPVAVGAVLAGGAAVIVPDDRMIVPITVATLGGAVAAYHLALGRREGEPIEPIEAVRGAAPEPLRRPLRLLLIAWVVVQLLLPIRPYLYPGDAAWTEEGQQFAWRLLLRTKRGTVFYLVRDPVTGAELRVSPTESFGGRELARGQLGNLHESPDMMIQFANFLEGELRPRFDGHDLEIRAETSVSLNGRPPAPLLDPDVDLTTLERPWWPPADFILPRPDTAPGSDPELRGR